MFSGAQCLCLFGRGREGLLGCLCGEPAMGNLTCRHLSLWVYNTGWALWANLLFESLILLFSCRAFTCLHPPAARCTASASVPPTCMLPWHQPCTSSTSQPREGHHSCFWSPQLSRADTWLRELQGRRGENGPQGFWEGDFFFFFFYPARKLY